MRMGKNSAKPQKNPGYAFVHLATRAAAASFERRVAHAARNGLRGESVPTLF